jgi:hypothetical protein
MEKSAEFVQGGQAAQGRQTLIEFGARHGIDDTLIDELRDILGAAMEGEDSDYEIDADLNSGMGMDEAERDESSDAHGTLEGDVDREAGESSDE